MKKTTLIFSSLFFIALLAKAQIPNSGFENWTSAGAYQDPTYWGSTNSYSAGPFYAVTKSLDNFPVSVGTYSVRIENNIAAFPPYAGRGALFTGPPPPQPNFPIVGAPTSLTGYYKFDSQNNDTMFIQIQLYYQGNSVAFGQYTSAASVSAWSSFNIPISAYALADSGSMILVAYNANGFNFVPHGNSVLYVDNLNFDYLITGVDQLKSGSTPFDLYPNPASDFVAVNRNVANTASITAAIFNPLGELVKSETITNNGQKISVKELANGIYTIELKSTEGSEKQKLVIQK